MRKNGFTFVELMIAIVIGTFVTVTAVAAMRGIASGKQTHQRLTELNDEVRYAERLIRQDLFNLYRSSDFKDSQFELSYLDTNESLDMQSLRFYTVSHRKVRPLQPEGDVYEVQYSIQSNPDTEHVYLIRRCCPVVPGVPQGDKDRCWGVLAPIAENIVAMKIRCYDGKEWGDEWNEKNGQFPGLIEVTLWALGDTEKLAFQRSFIVNIPRLYAGGDESDSQDQEETQQQENSSQDSNTDTQSSNMQNEGGP